MFALKTNHLYKKLDKNDTNLKNHFNISYNRESANQLTEKILNNATKAN